VSVVDDPIGVFGENQVHHLDALFSGFKRYKMVMQNVQNCPHNFIPMSLWPTIG
jgi:hypothetical protein